MITYNPAFDIYHCMYRMAHILMRLDDNEIIELDKLRIWDFYVLNPMKIYELRIKRNEKEYSEQRKTYIKRYDNPYEYTGNSRRLFEIIAPYQNTALNCLVAYGIIDKEKFSTRYIKIANKAALERLVHDTASLTDKEYNVISFLSIFTKNMPLLGEDGLKSRSHLMETRYDIK